MLEEQQQIYWYSGLYLQPQHFQSIDLHHSFMLARCRQFSQPYNQGYFECVINDGLLNEFTLRIEQIKAILPSGYYLEYPGNCILPDKCLSFMRNSDDKLINLWIALKRFNSKHANVSSSKDKRGSTRWVSSENEIIMRDIYHESPEVGITRIKYDVQIVTDEEKNNSTDCEFLPLTRIICEGKRIIIDPEYTFPSLRISADSVLKKKTAEIYSDLHNYKCKLEEYRYASQSLGDGDLVYLLILCAINRTLPMLASFLNEDITHPWLYYMELRQLVGEISSFDSNKFSELEVGDLTYKHFSQISCFSDIHRYLKLLLDVLCCDKNMSLAFNHITTDTLVCDFNGWLMKENSQYFIKLKSNFFKNKATNSFYFSEIKIAPNDHINMIIQHALPGIPLTNADVGAERKNIVLLKLDINSELWKEAEAHKKISFYWSHCPKDLQVELVQVAAHNI